ncbi:hypothetical protein H257_16746, partial [Aphanomyces astaci]
MLAGLICMSFPLEKRFGVLTHFYRHRRPKLESSTLNTLVVRIRDWGWLVVVLALRAASATAAPPRTLCRERLPMAVSCWTPGCGLLDRTCPPTDPVGRGQ